MTIECYYGNCRFHGTQSGDEGPFCFEEECRATEHELKLHGLLRQAYEKSCREPVVAWRYRSIDPEEGPSTWSVTTDPRDIAVIGGMPNFEVQPLKVVS